VKNEEHRQRVANALAKFYEKGNTIAVYPEDVRGMAKQFHETFCLDVPRRPKEVYVWAEWLRDNKRTDGGQAIPESFVVCEAWPKIARMDTVVANPHSTIKLVRAMWAKDVRHRREAGNYD
jgi:hypothetical protein